MYIAAMKTRFSKLDLKNLSIKYKYVKSNIPETKSSLEDMKMLPKKIIKNTKKLARRAKETFQMTLR